MKLYTVSLGKRNPVLVDSNSEHMDEERPFLPGNPQKDLRTTASSSKWKLATGLLSVCLITMVWKYVIMLRGESFESGYATEFGRYSLNEQIEC